ncbi:hypothetical protein PENSPDRAFT_688862 [Peniophora sp. CONT]|nr:hypothetical protein PENSPDRAFT_688862 [Peniophora sp. CONT]
MTSLSLQFDPALYGDRWEDTLYRLMRDLTLSLEPDCFERNWPSYVWDGAKEMREKLVKHQRSIERSAELLRRELARSRDDRSEISSYVTTHILVDGVARLQPDSHARARQMEANSSFDVSKVHETWQDLIKLAQRVHLFRFCGKAWEPTEVCALVFELDLAINWIIGALDVLRMNYARVEEARAKFTPVFRLNDDVMPFIFELLAETEMPSREGLGWFKLTHVCSAWKRVLLGMSRLWARDAYAYGACIATRHLLNRAQGAPISVRATRASALAGFDAWSTLRMKRVVFRRREHLDPLVSLANKQWLRDLHGLYENELAEDYDDQCFLSTVEHILGDSIQPHLRSIGIWLNGTTLPDRELRLMAPHPNLRHADFVGAFIPFALPNLVELQLVCSQREDPRMPQAWFDAMLDSIDSSPALRNLRVIQYSLPPPSTPRRIVAPHLEALSCTDAGIFESLELPALQRVQVVDGATDIVLSLHTGLLAIFERYGLSPRSLILSQRAGGTPERLPALILRFGWESLDFPLPPPIPLDMFPFMFEEPGSFASFAYVVDEEMCTRALSLLFTEYARVVRMIPGTDTIDTLVFDSETREHKFERQDGLISPAATQEHAWALTLPSFPAVQKIVLPTRDSDTVYHILSSLATDENSLQLPRLSCLSFIGPMRAMPEFMETSPALASLLRIRAAPVMGVSPITSIVCDLYDDGSVFAMLAATEVGTGPLRKAISKAVHSVLGDQASVTIQQEYAETNLSSCLRVLATITYHT